MGKPRGQIHELLARRKEWLAPNVALPLDQYICELATETDFRAAIEKWTPGLMEEVTGIAEGAQADFNEVFAFQLQDEELVVWAGIKAGASRAGSGVHFNWLGRDGSLPTLAAQNMDMPDYLDGYQVILRIQDPQTQVEALVFSTAGLIALNGLTTARLGWYATI